MIWFQMCAGCPCGLPSPHIAKSVPKPLRDAHGGVFFSFRRPFRPPSARPFRRLRTGRRGGDSLYIRSGRRGRDAVPAFPNMPHGARDGGVTGWQGGDKKTGGGSFGRLPVWVCAGAAATLWRGVPLPSDGGLLVAFRLFRPVRPFLFGGGHFHNLAECRPPLG